VCFDQDCYAGKWKKLIESLMAKEDIPRTENNIILDRGIPNFLPKKTGTVTMGETEYKVLSPQKHSWSETFKKAKKDTAWLVTAPYASTDVKVQRVAYKVYERPDYSGHSTPSDPVKDFLIDQVSDVAIEDQKAAAEKVMEKYQYSWNFTNQVKETLLDTIICKRIEEESRENLAAEYLTAHRSGEDGSGAYQEIDPDYADIFAAIFGPDDIAKPSDIPAGPIVQKLFLFLIATGIRANSMPDLNYSEAKWAEAETSLFWKFAQVTRDEYIMMYREILSAAVGDVLGPAREEGGEEPPEEGE
jgi:hypothetical protein